MLQVDRRGKEQCILAVTALSLLFSLQRCDGSLVLAAAHKSSAVEAGLKLIVKGTRLDCGC